MTQFLKEAFMWALLRTAWISRCRIYVNNTTFRFSSNSLLCQPRARMQQRIMDAAVTDKNKDRDEGEEMRLDQQREISD